MKAHDNNTGTALSIDDVVFCKKQPGERALARRWYSCTISPHGRMRVYFTATYPFEEWQENWKAFNPVKCPPWLQAAGATCLQRLQHDMRRRVARHRPVALRYATRDELPLVRGRALPADVYLLRDMIKFINKTGLVCEMTTLVETLPRYERRLYRHWPVQKTGHGIA